MGFFFFGGEGGGDRNLQITRALHLQPSSTFPEAVHNNNNAKKVVIKESRIIVVLIVIVCIRIIVMIIIRTWNPSNHSTIRVPFFYGWIVKKEARDKKQTVKGYHWDSYKISNGDKSNHHRNNSVQYSKKLINPDKARVQSMKLLQAAAHEPVILRLLGGPWDLVTTYNWCYNPTYNWGNPYRPI